LVQVEGTIGFGPFSRELEKYVVVLKLDGSYPTDRTYPSAVTLSLIHREETITDEARCFLNHRFTPKAQALPEVQVLFPLNGPFPQRRIQCGGARFLGRR
jgi:hypothetical protein